MAGVGYTGMIYHLPESIYTIRYVPDAMDLMRSARLMSLVDLIIRTLFCLY
jgi:hypothetical protein